MRESAVRRPVKPQGTSFRTVDDFLAFEEVDEEIYNDLVRIFSKYNIYSNSVYYKNFVTGGILRLSWTGQSS